MTPQIHFLIFFGLGVITQLAILLRKSFHRKNIGKLAGCVVFAIVGFVICYGCFDNYNKIERCLLFTLPFLVVGVFLLFNTEVMPSLNEQCVLQLSIVFIYFLSGQPNHIFLGTRLHTDLMICFVIFTFYSAFSQRKTKSFGQKILWFWFFVMITALSFHQMNILKIFNDGYADQLNDVNPVGVFISGVSFTYLLIALCYLVIFYLYICRKSAHMFKSFEITLTQKYDHTQLKRVEALFIILL